MNDELQTLAQQVSLLALDADGVLTSGMLYYDEQGGENKSFNVRDGLGLRLLREAGLEVVIISGRSSSSLSRRARELDIRLVFQGVRNKRLLLAEVLRDQSLKWEQVAYMGDDVNDLACLALVGLPMAPADAAPEVLAIARFVASQPGGQGAVRQACELILKARGQWLEVVDRFFNSPPG